MAKNKIIGNPTDISMYSNQFSFMSRPLTRKLKENVDAVILGVPFDLATTGRPGTRFGPSGVRNASSNLGWEENRWPWNFNVFDHLNVVDYGDVDYIPGKPEDGLAEIQNHATQIINAGKTLVSIGGDHFVTLPLLRSHYKKFGKMALVHFDAHTDTYPNDNLIDHGCMFYHAPKEGLIDPSHSIQIGIRTDYEKESHEFQVIDGAAANDLSSASIVESIQKRVGDLPVYLTFDIDCLDPAFAPGTGTPVVGGLSTDKALKIVRGLTELNIIGFDLVEVSPQYDHAEITALAGATIILEYLYLLGNKRKTI
jgi:agmatinase